MVWCRLYGWEDMLVIALTLYVSRLGSSAAEDVDGGGLSSFSSVGPVVIN